MYGTNKRLSAQRRVQAATILASTLLLSACAPVTPEWDARFGDSVRIAVAQQAINPDASRNADPVRGIDGRPAEDAVKRYHKSFQEPPPPAPLFQILSNMGGGR